MYCPQGRPLASQVCAVFSFQQHPDSDCCLAITLGPGVQWADAYAFAAENNVVIAGGIAAEGSVGAGGGWPLGGGHNILSPSLGLGTFHW